MELTMKWNAISLFWEKKEILFEGNEVSIDWQSISFPWEYEKSWIMAHVLEKGWNLLFQMKFLDKNVWYINLTELEITEDIVDFFWDIDVLLIQWSKESIKIFENLEAKYVVPFWEQKDVFFSTLWQHPEPVQLAKVKQDIWDNEVIFINLI